MTKLWVLTLLVVFAGLLIPVHAQTSGVGNIVVTVNQYCVMDGNWYWLPLKGADVNVVNVGAKQTDVTGNAYFTNLPVGTYSITAGMAGFYADAGSQPYMADVNDNQSTPVTLNLNPFGNNQTCVVDSTSTTTSMSTVVSTVTSTTAVPEFPLGFVLVLILAVVIPAILIRRKKKTSS